MSGFFKKYLKKSLDNRFNATSPQYTSGVSRAVHESWGAPARSTSRGIAATSDIETNPRRKKGAIDYGIQALDLLKDISDGSGALGPLGLICGATSSILKTIQTIGGNKEGWKRLVDTIQGHRDIFKQQLEFTNEADRNSTLDSRLQAPIKIYARSLKSILAAVMRESGLMEVQTRRDTRWQKFKDFVKEYDSADVQAIAIGEYTKTLEDAMQQFRMSISLFTATTVDLMRQEVQRALLLSGPGPTVAVLPEVMPRPSLVQDFIGRQDILSSMCITHIKGRSAGLQTPAMSVLHGLGGSGKTQIALKFAFDLEKSYPDMRIYFLDASSEESLQADLESIIRSSENIQGQKSYQDTLMWLATKFKNWSMILDNADIPSSRIFRYIPKCTHGNVIITTRNVTYGCLSRQSSYTVEGLSVNDAITLILGISAYDLSNANREMARQIVTKLGCMPLAVAQAGGYIFVNKCLSSYLAIYEKNQATFLESEETDISQDYRFTTAMTLRMSMEKLSPEAQDLMRIFAHLDSASIAHDIIATAANRGFRSIVWTKETDVDTKTLGLISTLNAVFGSSEGWSELSFSKLIGQCLQYSLLRQTMQGDTRCYSMHVLVQSYLRTRQDPIRGYPPSLLAIRLLGSSTTAGRPNEHLAISRLLAPHVKLIRLGDITEPGDHVGFQQVLDDVGDSALSAIHGEKCIEKWTTRFGTEHENTLSARLALATSYRRAGNGQQALEIEKNVLEIQRRTLGLEHPNTLLTLQNLTASYDQVGRHQEAVKLAEEVLEIRRRTLGPEHPDTLMSFYNLAVSYDAVGRCRQAVELYKQVLELEKKVFGVEHPDTLMTLQGLSASYYRLGQHRQALKLGEELLKLRKKVLGLDHPDTLTSIQGLIGSYEGVSWNEEALRLKEEMVEAQKRFLGREHPNTFWWMESLANSYDKIGQHQQSLRLTQELLELQKHALGPEHPDTLRSMLNLVYFYYTVGRYQEAVKLGNNTIALQKKVLGLEDPNTLISIHNLASSYEMTDRHMEALKLRKEVVDLRRRYLGSENPDTLTSMHCLAFSYNKVGQSQEALKLGEKVVALRKKVLGPEKPDTLASWYHIGLFNYDLGRYQEAVKIWEAVLERQKKVLGSENADTLQTMHDLVLSYHQVGRYQEAMTVGKVVLELRRKVLGPESSGALWSSQVLSGCYESLGRHWEALKLREGILTLRKRDLGLKNPDTLTAMGNVALSYHHLGQYQKAANLCKETLELQKKVQGPESADTLRTMHTLALAYYELGRYQEALTLGEVVLELRRKVLGPENLDTILSMHNLGLTYHQIARDQESRRLWEDLLSIRQRVLGPTHPDTLVSMNCLATSYETVGWYRQAQNLRKQMSRL